MKFKKLLATLASIFWHYIIAILLWSFLELQFNFPGIAIYLFWLIFFYIIPFILITHILVYLIYPKFQWNEKITRFLSSSANFKLRIFLLILMVVFYLNLNNEYNLIAPIVFFPYSIFSIKFFLEKRWEILGK